jgi:hypothetical protein
MRLITSVYAAMEISMEENELHALCGGANLSWVVKQALKKWVESSVLAGDSEVAIVLDNC